MRRASSSLAVTTIAAAVVVGCGVELYPEIDPLLICHNTNCSGTKQYGDDTLEALTESLALTTDGRPSLDGVEADTYLFWDGTKSSCLFAHDTEHLDTVATPRQAAALIADHLQKDDVAWNGERFYLKLEVKPTVQGSDQFHTAQQLQQHAECALDMAVAATAQSRHPVTLIFDSMSECLLNELQYQLTLPAWERLVTNANVDILFSAQVVPSRACIPARVDIRSINVKRWDSSAIDAIRPFMVWMDSHSENTETMKIVRHLDPEYISTSELPFVRGYVEGLR
jgi:hypothetical protein